MPGEDLLPGSITEGAVTFEAWEKAPRLLDKPGSYLLLEQRTLPIREIKRRLNEFCLHNDTAPVVFHTVAGEIDREIFRLKLAGELGYLLVDGAVDAVYVESTLHPQSFVNETLLHIFQAAGARISKTEYIACPSCGRTHFDILERLKEIRHATSHLVSLKIGVMGCIVNGPGEMADADYGYVGSGRGRITLYKGKEARVRGIPENEALSELISLMKQEGDWRDPPENAPPG
jgi:(E)-4-hydroxy-3-methylbut-2-enyl-diphosphate synthase